MGGYPFGGRCFVQEQMKNEKREEHRVGQINQSGLNLNSQAQDNLNALTNFTLSNENISFNLTIVQVVAAALTIALPLFAGGVGVYVSVREGLWQLAPLGFLFGLSISLPISAISGLVWWRVSLIQSRLRNR